MALVFPPASGTFEGTSKFQLQTVGNVEVRQTIATLAEGEIITLMVVGMAWDPTAAARERTGVYIVSASRRHGTTDAAILGAAPDTLHYRGAGASIDYATEGAALRWRLIGAAGAGVTLNWELDAYVLMRQLIAP